MIIFVIIDYMDGNQKSYLAYYVYLSQFSPTKFSLNYMSKQKIVRNTNILTKILFDLYYPATTPMAFIIFILITYISHIDPASNYSLMMTLIYLFAHCLAIVRSLSSFLLIFVSFFVVYYLLIEKFKEIQKKFELESTVYGRIHSLYLKKP